MHLAIGATSWSRLTADGRRRTATDARSFEGRSNFRPLAERVVRARSVRPLPRSALAPRFRDRFSRPVCTEAISDWRVWLWRPRPAKTVAAGRIDWGCQLPPLKGISMLKSCLNQLLPLTFELRGPLPNAVLISSSARPDSTGITKGVKKPYIRTIHAVLYSL